MKRFSYALLLILAVFFGVAFIATSRSFLRGNGTAFDTISTGILFIICSHFVLRFREKAKKKKETQKNISFERDYQADKKQTDNPAVSYWENDLATVWNGDEEITFSYLGDSGRTRRTIDLHTVFQDHLMSYYLRGHCHLRNEERTFNLEKIPTMITQKDKKKHKKEDFLSKVLGIKLEEISPEFKDIHARQRNNYLTRFRSIWSGEEKLSFTYWDKDGTFSERIDLALSDVVLSKSGYIYLLGIDFGKCRVFSSYQMSPNLIHADKRKQLIPFLLSDLEIHTDQLGIHGLWKGQKRILITAKCYGQSLRKKEVFLAALLKDKTKTIFWLCYNKEEDNFYYIPWFDVKSVYINDKRLSPRTFLESHLSIYLPKKDYP